MKSIITVLSVLTVFVSQAQFGGDQRSVTIHQREDDDIFKRHIFLDILLGYSTNYRGREGYYTTTISTAPYSYTEVELPYKKSHRYDLFQFGVRVGNVMYFGAGERFRTGLKLVWLKARMLRMDQLKLYLAGIISPVQVGSSNMFQLPTGNGFELNGDIGPALIFTGHPGTLYEGSSSFVPGVQYSFEAKYHGQKYSLGLSFSEVYGKRNTAMTNYREKYSMAQLSAGLKF